MILCNSYKWNPNKRKKRNRKRTATHILVDVVESLWRRLSALLLIYVYTSFLELVYCMFLIIHWLWNNQSIRNITQVVKTIILPFGEVKDEDFVASGPYRVTKILNSTCRSRRRYLFFISYFSRTYFAPEKILNFNLDQNKKYINTTQYTKELKVYWFSYKPRFYFAIFHWIESIVYTFSYAIIDIMNK